MLKRPLLAAATLLLAVAAVAAPPSKKSPPEPDPAGVVTRVVDGDTLWVMTADPNAAPLVVRLEGIDAPERCQSGGPEAADAMTKIALGRQVVLKVKARDSHGRLVARVLRDGEFDLGDRMVRDGQAWSARYRYDRGPYVAQERMAEALNRGVHADAAAVLPAEFRRRHGPCELKAAAAPK
jgi:micrococcal nuclease